MEVWKGNGRETPVYTNREGWGTSCARGELYNLPCTFNLLLVVRMSWSCGWTLRLLREGGVGAEAGTYTYIQEGCYSSFDGIARVSYVCIYKQGLRIGPRVLGFMEPGAWHSAMGGYIGCQG